MAGRRFLWLLFVPSLLLAYAATISPWFVLHAPGYPAPYVVGYAIAWAFSATLYPLYLVAFCIVIGFAPKARSVVMLGIVAGVFGGALVAAYTGNGNPAHFNMATAERVPSLASALVVIVSYYVYVAHRHHRLTRG